MSAGDHNRDGQQDDRDDSQHEFGQEDRAAIDVPTVLFATVSDVLAAGLGLNAPPSAAVLVAVLHAEIVVA